MTTADRMAVLDHGVVQQVGTPTELYDQPVNLFVAGFVGTTNLVPARLRARDADAVVIAVDGVGDVRLPSDRVAPAGAALTLSFRPQALRIEAPGATRDPQRQWLPAQVEASEFLGEFTRYRMRLGGHPIAVDEPHHAGTLRHPPGTPVVVGLDPTQARLFAVTTAPQSAGAANEVRS